MWLLWNGLYLRIKKKAFERKSSKLQRKPKNLSLCMRLTWKFSSKADLEGKKGKTWGKTEKAICADSKTL